MIAEHEGITVPENQNVQTLSVEVHHLQVGQSRIETKVDKLTEHMDGLIRIIERHDALSNRVDKLEADSKARAEIAHRGQSYMTFARLAAPIILGFIVTYCGWMYNKVGNIAADVSAIKIFNAKTHPGEVE